MKRTLSVVIALIITFAGWSQPFIHGSIREGASANKVDILFKPDAGFDNPGGGGTFISFMQFGVAVPAAGNGTLVATFTPAAQFSGLNFVAQPAYNFTAGPYADRIYNWVCVNPGTVTNMTWTGGTPFVVGTVAFTLGGAPDNVKLVDLTTQVGDGNTFFVITLNAGNDPTDYGTFFYQEPGANGSSIPTTYGPSDKFVETNLLISLPVHLLNFSGYKNGGKNTLNWTVASEVNNKGFDVLRSTDGVSYSSIGFVNSQVGGNSNSEVHYTFDDNSPVGVKQYYLLSQKDFDGRSKQSQVIMLNRDKATVLGIGGLYPNPASTVVNVMIDAPQRDNVTLLITDMGGKLVKQQQASVDIGSNTIPVNIAVLAGGTYLVKLNCQSSDCNVAAAKFNKQ